MTKRSESFQRQFFERLGHRFPGRAEMVYQVGEVLHLGKDAVYRRMRGDTSLTADELMKLATYFNVRLQEKQRDVPLLGYPQEQVRLSSEAEYVFRLWENTREIMGLHGVTVDYASPELPMFHELSTPVLRGFKMFMYGITTWGMKKFRGKAFSPQLIDPRTHEYAEKLTADIYTLPGRELWSVRILDVTLRQITYIHQVGRFADEQTPRDLFRELYAIVDHLEDMARSGKRFPMGERPRPDSPDFAVYHNELSNTSNAILIKSPARTFLFNTIVAPNYAFATDERIVADVQFWFDELTKMGTRLSMDSAKYTSGYFEQLRQQLRNCEQIVTREDALF